VLNQLDFVVYSPEIHTHGQLSNINLDCDFPMMKQPPTYDYITYSQSMHHVTIFPLQNHFEWWYASQLE